MTDNEHTSKQFDLELNDINDRVQRMGQLVADQVQGALSLLGGGNPQLAEALIANDHRVNLYEVEIDEECDRIVARRQPTANDLRTIMAVIKIVTDLERIGDEAKNIAHVAKRHLATSSFYVMQSLEIRRTAQAALKILQTSLANLKQRDIAAAVRLVAGKSELENQTGYIVRPLVMDIMGNPHAVSAGLDAMLVSKSIERIAEHAINVSEHVVYMLSGKDVRHIPAAEIERKINE